MFARLLFLIGLLLMSVFITPFIYLPFVFTYAMRWFAPEIIVAGSLLDAYFGGASAWPIYTIGAFLVVAAAELGKRYLMFRSPAGKIG